MSTSPLSPTVQQGALRIQLPGELTARTIYFQFNPETMTRRLVPQLSGGGQNDHSTQVNYGNAPLYTISIEILLDATDQLNKKNKVAQEYGVFPQLALLETTLLYPSATAVQQVTSSLNDGVMEVAPYTAPIVQLVWGDNRSIPVRVTQYAAVEELFAPNLAPIRARVSLELQAVTWSDVDPSNENYSLFQAYQQALENLAKMV
ncbi:MAG: hypothetical protein U0414_16945 [Polyangiaceae bacterium]